MHLGLNNQINFQRKAQIGGEYRNRKKQDISKEIAEYDLGSSDRHEKGIRVVKILNRAVKELSDDIDDKIVLSLDFSKDGCPVSRDSKPGAGHIQVYTKCQMSYHCGIELPLVQVSLVDDSGKPLSEDEVIEQIKQKLPPTNDEIHTGYNYYKRNNVDFDKYPYYNGNITP